MRVPPLAAGLLLSLTTHTTEAALTPYTSDGQNLVYSGASNLTWTGDANLLATLEARNPDLINTIISAIGSITDTPNDRDTPSNSGSHTLTTADFNVDGRVSWFGALAYVSYLNTINYAGSSQWTLPSPGANPQIGYNPIGSQFGQLVYNELGGRPGLSISNTAHFTNYQSYGYWLAPEFGLTFEYEVDYSYAWIFYSGISLQSAGNKGFHFSAWAVSPGQVFPLPVPNAFWLFGAGLLGLLSFKQREHAG